MVKFFGRTALFRALLCLYTSVFLSLLLGLTTTYAATYTVDTLTYAPDDGECVTDTTLLDAINCADNNAGQDTIDFSVSGTITITDANLTLDPQTTDALGVILDCAGNITLNGGSIGGPRTIGPSTVQGCTFDGFTDALTIQGDNATIGAIGATGRNEFINWGGAESAIVVSGANDVNILNNWIGTTDGTTAASGYTGILVQSADRTTIGGTSSDERNIIAGNGASGFCGIFLQNSVGETTISANYIGVATDGTTGFGHLDGICTNSGETYSSRIMIGGATNDERNLISGNVNTGIQLENSTFDDLQIVNNYIGINAAGSAAIGTSGYTQSEAGIKFDGADSSTLGDSRIQKNVISGNDGDGIYMHGNASQWQFIENTIGLNPAGNTAIANGDNGIECNTCVNNRFGTTDTTAIDGPNLISGNTNNGIYLYDSGSNLNLISENVIGMNRDTDGAIANGGSGIYCDTCGSLTIGNSSTNNTMNVIAGNTDDAIRINSNSGAIGIYSNALGAVGSTAYANGDNGVEITNNPTDVITIGNTTSAGGNLISGNAGNGILIQNSGTAAHVIKGNRIGLTKNGLADLGNNTDGIRIENSVQNVTIGGSGAGEGNYISGHGGDGIEIAGGANHVILGNTIGLDVNGTTAIQNEGQGINISANGDNAGNIYIGVTADGLTHVGNIISGNLNNGILLTATGASLLNIDIQANYIGTNTSASAAIANGGDGIRVLEGSTIVIGGSDASSANIISGNTDNGIEVNNASTNASGVTITGNYIGTNTSDTDLGNTGAGVLINNGATNTTLGYAYADTIDSPLAKANIIGFNGNGSDNDVTLDGATTATNVLRGNVFSLSSGDGSANMAFNSPSQGGASNSGTSITTLNTGTFALTTDAPNGKVDWYSLDGSYVTTFEGTSTISGGAASLSGGFTAGEEAFYQITLADGTSYPFASGGIISAIQVAVPGVSGSSSGSSSKKSSSSSSSDDDSSSSDDESDESSDNDEESDSDAEDSEEENSVAESSETISTDTDENPITKVR